MKLEIVNVVAIVIMIASVLKLKIVNVGANVSRRLVAEKTSFFKLSHKFVILYALLFLVFKSLGQFQEDFSDFDLAVNPKWHGDTAFFETLVEDDKVVLRSNFRSDKSSAALAVSNSQMVSTWGFKVKLDFAPSASNNLSVYLVADTINLNHVKNGYYIKIGKSGSDDGLDFYKRVEGKDKLIFKDDVSGLGRGGEVFGRVARDARGNWLLQTFKAGKFETLARFQDSSVQTTRYFGFLMRYTSTRVKGFTLDSISLQKAFDFSPPYIIDSKIIGTKTLELHFNEPVHDDSLFKVQNYRLNSSERPASIRRLDPDKIELSFENNFKVGANILEINYLKDTSNNFTLSSRTLSFQVPDKIPPTLNSIEPLENNTLNVVFSEPIDSLSLAGARNFSLEGQMSEVFEYQVKDSIITLSFTENLVIGQTYTLLVQAFKDTAGNRNLVVARKRFIFSDQKAPEVVSITNVASYSLLLMFSERIDYQNTKANINLKLAGLDYKGTVQTGDAGSLHIIFDKTLPENKILNLEVENIYDPFGNISSKQNLNFSYDTQKPSLKSSKIIDDRTLKFIFSEKLKRENAVAYNHYQFEPSLKIQKITYREDTISLVLANPLLPETKYKLTLKNIADEAGNLMNNKTLSLFFDKRPPYLKSSMILFSKVIQLHFSEALKPDSARLLKNYTFKNGSAPDKIELPSPNRVNLDYTNSFANLDTLALEMSGLVDLAGNRMPDTLLKLDLHYPKIQNVHVLDSQHLMLWLSEPIMQNLNLEGFKIDMKSALAFEFLDSTRLKLKFESVFENKYTDTLKTLEIRDSKGFANRDLKNGFQSISRLEQIRSKTAQTLELEFTHQIDTTNLKRNLFTLTPAIYPSKVQFFSNLPTKILLFFDEPLAKNRPQNLRVGNIQFTDAKIQFSTLETFTIDTLPPQIEKVHLFKNYAVLFLDEPPNLIFTQIVNNYVLADGTLPANVALIEKRIYLRYNLDFQSDRTYSLEIKELRDNFNNAIQNQKIKLQNRRQISKNDLLITEIMANPVGNDKLKYEYVELYNTSSQTIELLDLRIADLNTSTVLPPYELAPQTYVILTASGFASEYYNNLKINTLGIAKFPNLNNSAETLTLSDEAANLIEQVHYKDSWYQSNLKKQGGYSLERLNFESVCHSASNWSGSASLLKGSPAQPNTALKHDTLAPTIKELKYIDSRTIFVYFNEPLDTTQSINLNADRFNLKTDRLEVFFDTPLPIGRPYRLSIKGLKDCAGNSKTSAVDLLSRSVPQIGDLIITEIMVDPTPAVGLPPVEYIELYNRSQFYVDISDYQLVVGNKQFNLERFILAPRAYLLLTDAEGYEYFKAKTAALAVANFPSLPNESGFIALKNSKSDYSFYLNYTDRLYKNDRKRAGGYSLEILDLDNFCLTEDNWQASEAVLGGTPGTINSVNAQIAEAESIRATAVFAISKSSVYIRSNQNLAANQANLEFKVNPVLKVDSLIIKPQRPKLIEIKLNKALQAEQFYQVQISNLANCRGEVNSDSQSFTFKFAAEPADRDLIFNELLFENEAPTPEFLEVYNKTERYLNLQNLKLARVSEAGKRNLKVLIAEPYVLEPESYLVFTSDKKNLSKLYEVDKDQIVELNLGSFNNTSDRLVLLNACDTQLDSLRYDTDWHLSFLKEKRNVALERIDFDSPTQDKNNWQSAAQSANFATPTRLNSQAKSVVGLARACFEVDPIFSPDFDGIDDFMILRYDCRAQNNSLTIHIYDLTGRLVKALVENYSIGRNGFLKWDGTDESGQVVALGHYILDIVVFNPQGNRTKIRKKVVVGTKF